MFFSLLPIPQSLGLHGFLTACTGCALLYISFYVSRFLATWPRIYLVRILFVPLLYKKNLPHFSHSHVPIGQLISDFFLCILRQTLANAFFHFFPFFKGVWWLLSRFVIYKNRNNNGDLQQKKRKAKKLKSEN